MGIEAEVDQDAERFRLPFADRVGREFGRGGGALLCRGPALGFQLTDVLTFEQAVSFGDKVDFGSSVPEGHSLGSEDVVGFSVGGGTGVLQRCARQQGCETDID